VVILGYPDDRFDHIWEAAATAAPLFQRVVDLGRDDELPGVLLEQGYDRLFDLLFRYDVAVANEHFGLWNWLRGASGAAWLARR
jgi:hypothetical protein